MLAQKQKITFLNVGIICLQINILVPLTQLSLYMSPDVIFTIVPQSQYYQPYPDVVTEWSKQQVSYC